MVSCTGRDLEGAIRFLQVSEPFVGAGPREDLVATTAGGRRRREAWRRVGAADSTPPLQTWDWADLLCGDDPVDAGSRRDRVRRRKLAVLPMLRRTDSGIGSPLAPYVYGAALPASSGLHLGAGRIPSWYSDVSLRQPVLRTMPGNRKASSAGRYTQVVDLSAASTAVSRFRRMTANTARRRSRGALGLRRADHEAVDAYEAYLDSQARWGEGDLLLPRRLFQALFRCRSRARCAPLGGGAHGRVVSVCSSSIRRSLRRVAFGGELGRLSHHASPCVHMTAIRAG
jgi:hypothetical protein